MSFPAAPSAGCCRRRCSRSRPNAFCACSPTSASAPHSDLAVRRSAALRPARRLRGRQRSRGSAAPAGSPRSDFSRAAGAYEWHRRVIRIAARTERGRDSPQTRARFAWPSRAASLGLRQGIRIHCRGHAANASWRQQETFGRSWTGISFLERGRANCHRHGQQLLDEIAFGTKRPLMLAGLKPQPDET